MKTLLIATAIAFASIVGTTAIASAEGYGKQKVVYHINYDNPKKQAGALRNIQNHINAVGAKNLDLKVVLHGNGLSLLLSPDAIKHTKMKAANANEAMVTRIDNLRSQGVSFQVCNNTLNGRKISFENDLHFVDKKHIVPSGVAELARLQQMGYAYIKP